MFVAMISTGTVVIKEYACTYIGNICPRLDMVLCLIWISSVYFSGTEGFTSGCWYSVDLCIGDLWVSYYCTVTAAGYSGSESLSLVVRP